MKRAGNRFERELAKELSSWICKACGVEEKLIMWRVGSSGAVYSQTGEEAEDLHGDLVAVDPLASPFLRKFNVEAKKRKKFDFSSLLRREGDWEEFLKWWRQACIPGYYPLLILRVSYKGRFVFTSKSAVEEIASVSGRPRAWIEVRGRGGEAICGFSLDEFKDWAESYIRYLCRREANDPGSEG